MTKVILLVLIFLLHTVVTSMPCSSSPQLSSVINICSSRKVEEDSFYKNILLQITTTEECQCTLSITNHVEPIAVIFRKYNTGTSIPSNNNCGVELYLESINGIFRLNRCDIFDTIYQINTINTGSDLMIFTRATTTGSLKKNEGYCLEITIDFSKKYNLNRKLRLACNNSADSAITPDISTLDENTTTEPYNTIDTESSFKLYISIGAILGGGFVVLVLIISFLVKKRCNQKTDTNENYVNTRPIPLYDDLLATPIDNTANYTTLQSSYIATQFQYRQNIRK